MKTEINEKHDFSFFFFSLFFLSSVITLIITVTVSVSVMKIENAELQNGLISTYSRSWPKIKTALIELFLIPQVLQQSIDSMSQFHSMLIVNVIVKLETDPQN